MAKGGDPYFSQLNIQQKSQLLAKSWLFWYDNGEVKDMIMVKTKVGVVKSADFVLKYGDNEVDIEIAKRVINTDTHTLSVSGMGCMIGRYGQETMCNLNDMPVEKFSVGLGWIW